MKTFYYYNRLSKNAQIIYNGLRKAIENLDEVANIAGHVEKKEIADILYALRYDNPEYYYFNWIDSYIIRAYSIEFKLNYTYPVKTIPGRNNYVKKKIEDSLRIYRERQISDEFSTSLWIHNHVARMVTYDYESYEGKTEKRKYADAHSIAGVFCRKTAVCEGIALAYKLLCDQLGIYCIVVVGEANSVPSDDLNKNSGHAWNMIRIGGQYAHVDVTWDMCLSRSCKKNRYDYFGVADQILISNHKWGNYPKCFCNTGLTFFEQKGCIISSIEELDRFLNIRLSNKPDRLYFQIKKERNKAVVSADDVQQYVQKKVLSHKCKSYIYYNNKDLGIYLFLLNY